MNISPYAFHQRGAPLTPWGHSPTSLLSIVWGHPLIIVKTTQAISLHLSKKLIIQ